MTKNSPKIEIFADFSKEGFSEEKAISYLLKRRRVENLREFLDPPSPLSFNMASFGLEKELFKVIDILKKAKKDKQMIVVYTDYDADGITGGAILWETLYLLGFRVMPYVPNRVTEGYGFSIKGIDKMIKLYNPKLVFSVDQGITKIREVDYLNSKGIKVIISDHHLKKDKLPKAEAIFHISSLSGAGVAYFLAKGIFDYFRDSKDKNHAFLESYFEKDYLALASIGSVADLVSLVGPTRSIVKWGLPVFNQVERVGLRYLLKEAGIYGKEITPYDIGFIIAPRINAAGRLKSAIEALRLLCTKRKDRAWNLANLLGATNKQRQAILEHSIAEAEVLIEKNKLYNKKLIFLISDTWHEGIIGLVASKIVEKYYRPTIVVTKINGFYKGSARSTEKFNITNFLKLAAEELVDVGGHQAAAGFTLSADKLTSFQSKIYSLAEEKITKSDLEKILVVDIKVRPENLTLSFAKKIKSLAPFGVGNPPPLFLVEGIIKEAKIFGKKNEHLKFWLGSHLNENNQKKIEVIAFNESQIFFELSRETPVQLVVSLESASYQGKEYIFLKLIHWLTN